MGLCLFSRESWPPSQSAQHLSRFRNSSMDSASFTFAKQPKNSIMYPVTYVVFTSYVMWSSFESDEHTGNEQIDDQFVDELLWPAERGIDSLPKLDSGGPEVDHSSVIRFVAGALTEPGRSEVGRHIMTWKSWYAAYVELMDVTHIDENRPTD